MSLLAWYPLMGNTNNYGVGDAEPTITTTPVYVDGKLGKAMNSGGLKWTASQTAGILNNDELTIAFWLYVNTEPTGSTTTHRLFGNDSNRRFTLFLYPNCNSLHWSWNETGGATGAVSNSVPSYKWTHVCVTYKNPNATIYINGEVIKTFTTTSAVESFAAETTVIANNTQLYRQDFRVYNHALSKKEVKELAKGLCLHLPLDWGANPNMIKNSYTWMNKALGNTNGTSATLIATKSIVEDDTAPCKWKLKVSLTNSSESALGQWVGPYFTIGAKGLTTTDLIENEYYTYSFWAKSNTGLNNGFSAGSVVEGQTKISDTGFGTLTSNWRYHTVTFKFTKTTSLTTCFYVSVPANSTVDFELCGIKLEKGQKATPYIPHVEETEYSTLNFGEAYKVDCSGFAKTVNKGGTPIIAEGSPRGTGTYMTSASLVSCFNGFPTDKAIPNWTIAFWFKPNIGQTFTRYSDVFRVWWNTETGNNTAFRLEVEQTTGNRYQLFYQNSGQSATGGSVITNITEKIWYHVALTCDGTKIYQYVNGTQVSNFTISSSWLPTGPTGQIQFGDTGMYASYADCRVYSTCLSADDIKELYQVGAQIDKSGNFYCNKLVEV